MSIPHNVTENYLNPPEPLYECVGCYSDIYTETGHVEGYCLDCLSDYTCSGCGELYTGDYGEVRELNLWDDGIQLCDDCYVNHLDDFRRDFQEKLVPLPFKLAKIIADSPEEFRGYGIGLLSVVITSLDAMVDEVTRQPNYADPTNYASRLVEIFLETY